MLRLSHKHTLHFTDNFVSFHTLDFPLPDPSLKMTNSSTSLNTSEQVDARMAHLKTLISVVPIVVPILFTLVIIIGFIGNILVVMVVIFDKTMRNTTNILIFNLAVSNITFKYSLF